MIRGKGMAKAAGGKSQGQNLRHLRLAGFI